LALFTRQTGHARWQRRNWSTSHFDFRGKKQIDEVRSGGSFISHNDFRLHFGLGKANSAIYLCIGLTEKPKISSRSRGQIVTIQEGKGIVASGSYFGETLTVSLSDNSKER